MGKKKYTREQMIEVMRSFNKEYLSRRDIDKFTSMGSATITREFGNWRNALDAAGLQEGKITGRPTSKLSFCDRYSYKCMLGVQSKNIIETKDYAKWEVNGKRHIVFFRKLRKSDLDLFELPISFHYLSEEDIELLKTKYNVEKHRLPSVYLDLRKTLDLSGRKNKSIRQKYQRINKLDIKVENNYRNIKDVEEFVKTWSGIDGLYGDKYFRNLSGKNLFYYRNNFHKECINVFLYYGDKLIAYGTLSPPNRKGVSTYIVGKALYNELGINGLSEFLDLVLYERGWRKGVRYVNLGASFSKQLLEYKRKFSGQSEFNEFEGKVLRYKNA